MNNDELLKLNQEKNKVLEKINFLLESLQDVGDEEEKNATLELINKLKLRLYGINKQIEGNNLSNKQDNDQVSDTNDEGVEEQEAYEEEQDEEEQQEEDQDDDDDELSEAVDTDEDETQETYDEESDGEDSESPKIYVGRKDNGNILGYYHRAKKQGN